MNNYRCDELYNPLINTSSGALCPITFRDISPYKAIDPRLKHTTCLDQSDIALCANQNYNDIVQSSSVMWHLV